MDPNLVIYTHEFYIFFSFSCCHYQLCTVSILHFLSYIPSLIWLQFAAKSQFLFSV